MLVRIIDTRDVLTVETDNGWREHGPEMPCHRCGVCCERWQPLISVDDAERLAAHLGMSFAAFRAAYTEPYPFDDERWLLRHEGGGCVFLRFSEDDGVARAGCAVHPARPAVCREWTAGFDKKECIQGLARFARPDGAIPLESLYPDGAERAAYRLARGALARGALRRDEAPARRASPRNPVRGA
jgi:Fe-S-cluster containining protein